MNNNLFHQCRLGEKPKEEALEIEVLYQDDFLVAVNKPCGILVHRTQLAAEETDSVLDAVQAQTGKVVYTLHRLDRPTSGVLLFAFSKEIASLMGKQFTANRVKKKYLALVRGWMTDAIKLDYPVKNEKKDKSYEAITKFIPMEKIEIPYSIGNYSSARYTLVECYPHTGRWHQIRQHLAHLRHYIVNDRVHGDGHHNRLFADIGIQNIFLHAAEVSFVHPITGTQLLIEAEKPANWEELFRLVKQTTD